MDGKITSGRSLRPKIYRPTEGGRLSRHRHCSKGAQPVTKVVYRSSCRDKHNRPQCDSNSGLVIRQSDALPLGHKTWNWVIGSPGQWVIWVIFHVWVTGSPNHHFDPLGDLSFLAFRKNAQNAKRTFVKIRPTVIEILTFNERSSKFYFPEACKRQSAIKTGKPLAHCKR